VTSRLGVPTKKIEALNDYAKSSLFIEPRRRPWNMRTRDATSMTQLFARLQRHYDDDTIAELMMTIA
jgi:hypothetical protein